MVEEYQRLVEIYVTPETRDKIKKIKRELTYEQFLVKLLKGIKE